LIQLNNSNYQPVQHLKLLDPPRSLILHLVQLLNLSKLIITITKHIKDKDKNQEHIFLDLQLILLKNILQ